MKDRALVRPSMRRHIFYALLLTSAVIVAVVVTAAAFVMQRGFLAAGARDLRQECAVVAAALNEAPDQVDMLARIDFDDVRMTLIDPAGSVVYDSVGGVAHMENHADRPEIVEATENGYGYSMRESSTSLTVLLYGAQRLDDGSVVRLSVTRDSVLGVLVDIVPLAVLLVGAGLALCAAVSRYLSNRLVAPFAAIDPLHPVGGTLDAGPYEEIAPLLERIEEQHVQIEQQLDQLTDNDRMRVEFTANVTHELKTPLTVVSGYAELIKTGIAAPDDVAGFAGRIYDEAQHLTALVNDILTLSRMDEAERIDEKYGITEPVDLGELCAAVVGRLAGKAGALGVALALEVGEGVVTDGVPKLLDQIVYNLCDNALRYNRPGGTVCVRCGLNAQGRPFLSVEDTGIGIAEENLEKVFNRFFRVDAGRSRETGGTGLGLAIVKHAARCHDAELHIESELGKGTVISVVFKEPAAL